MSGVKEAVSGIDAGHSNGFRVGHSSQGWYSTDFSGTYRARALYLPLPQHAQISLFIQQILWAIIAAHRMQKIDRTGGMRSRESTG